MWSRWYQQTWPTLPYARRSEGGEQTTAERYQEIARTITRLAEIRPDDRVLDLGCSIGAISYELAQHCGSVVGVDFIGDSLAYAREYHAAPNVQYVHADLAEYEVDGPYDCIVINNVLHMLDSWEIARDLLRRCYAGLAPAGRIYLGEVPDTRKIWRYATKGGKGARAFAHLMLPSWSIPALSKVLRRPLVGKVLWFNRTGLARIIGCPAAQVTVHDEPGTLLNPVERSHFVIRN